MIVDGERLIIDFDMKLDEVDTLKMFLVSRLNYIDEIVSESEPVKLSTLALLQLLFSVKKSRPEIKIPFLESHSYVDTEIGTIRWDDLWT